MEDLVGVGGAGERPEDGTEGREKEMQGAFHIVMKALSQCPTLPPSQNAPSHPPISRKTLLDSPDDE